MGRLVSLAPHSTCLRLRHEPEPVLRLPILPRRLLLSPTLGSGEATSKATSLPRLPGFELFRLLLHPPCSRRGAIYCSSAPAALPSGSVLSFSPQHRQFVELPIQLLQRQFVKTHRSPLRGRGIRREDEGVQLICVVMKWKRHSCQPFSLVGLYVY